MDPNLNAKIERLKRIKDVDLPTLHRLMKDPYFKPAKIAQDEFISESSLRRYITNIYRDLDIPDDIADKRGYLIREYGEAYKIVFPEAGEIPSKATIDVKPPNKRVRPALIIGGILVAFFLISVTAITTLILFTRFLNRPTPVIALTEENAVAAMVEQLAPSMFPTEVVPTTIPTPQPTPIPPTKIPAFTPTPKPTIPYPTNTVVSIPLPFSDDFSSGAKPSWTPLQGNWLVANGRYTKSSQTLNWEFSVLDDSNWSDYRIKVNVQKGWHDYGDGAVIVRYGHGKFLVFRVDHFLEKAGWAIYDGKNFSKIVGYDDIRVPHEYELEITAIGNVFSSKINGTEGQQIILDGFEKGGVGIGCTCGTLPCASFDNFEITAP